MIHLIQFKERMIKILEPSIGFIVGVMIGLALTAFAGENPLNVLHILIKSSLGSNYDIGLTLSYTAPLIFSGLSVALAFHAGMFNIGSEGQLTMAVLAATLVGVTFPQVPFPLAPLLALIAAIVAGGIWGGIAGYLRAYRGSHEVIVTIMLNFIAAGWSSYIVLYKIPNPLSQNPESQIVGSGYLIKEMDPIAKMFPDTPANISILFAILLCVLVWFILKNTKLGFHIKAVGQNEVAAQYAGISAKRIRFLALVFSGALAGFVALSEVMGSSGQFRIGFSPDYGFMGIAVALMARNHPLGVMASAFLFGALHKGTSDLDMETATITRDFSKILQAVIILSVSAHGLWSLKKWRSDKNNLKKDVLQKGGEHE
jgi:ABC-type uncharacterized transport system permease subunit